MTAFKPDHHPPCSTGLFSAILIGTLLSINSIFQRKKSLIKLNWLIIVLVESLIVFIAYIIDPQSVSDSFFGVMLLSVFTGGGPLWLIFIPFIWHTIACSYQDLTDNTSNK